MIYKETVVSSSDKTSVKILKIFHLYKGFNRKVSFEGFFVKGSALKVRPPIFEYKGFKRKYSKKGDICRSVLIKTNCTKNNFSNVIRFYKNATVLIKKKNLTKSKYLFGLASRLINRKKIIILFPKYF